MHYYGQNTWTLTDIPFLCRTLKDREMARESLSHDIVELVGGPYDGKILRESSAVKIEHNVALRYKFGNAVYSPWKVETVNGRNVLKLKYAGKWEG